MKWIGKLLTIPALLAVSVLWIVVKALTAIYGLCYGLLGIGAVAAYIYQKHCIEKQSVEELLENTKLSEQELNLFIEYFDVREEERETLCREQ